ncbi:MAG: OmpA family protein, partial [Cyanobacteria bacterium]|nr:OmpA family protein [Cyanobacteriota bacterium]MDW8201831.1 right-handed parallel beta-helix repeat-containing protein [Cyanobacteriota bacterium SKYGB_h_bin112]
RVMVLTCTSIVISVGAMTGLPTIARTQTLPSSLRIVVTSNQDTIQADDAITLREALALANGTLTLAQLSPAEQALVSPGSGTNRIEFNLPAGQTTIQLRGLLPDITNPGLTIDGTTQPGYNPAAIATVEIPIPIPVVTITPAPGVEIFRGLTITADNVTVRGLSLYGFTAKHRSTAVTPPADIFVAHRLPPPDTTQQQQPAKFFPFYDRDVPPQGVLIENNWLGISPFTPPNSPDHSPSAPQSAFGVSVFNSKGTTIRRNYITRHDGSGVITSVRAENTQIIENLIVGNGVAGMPDGIRLEGVISQSLVRGNLICGNDGSGVYLFKPDGSVQIAENQIIYNGRRLRRAAVYLMGSGHQVLDNQIRYQTSAGVVVAAFPQSDRNVIRNNQFSDLEGLSIDLNAQQAVGVQDYQGGDGVNPPRNSPNRRKETGNAAIDAPSFLSSEFLLRDGKVAIDGIAEPGARVDLYLVTPIADPLLSTPNSALTHGPLSRLIASTTADQRGRFGVTVDNLQAGQQISAIATLPDYGTSEPALNATVRVLLGGGPTSRQPSAVAAASAPSCTTPPPPLSPSPPALSPSPSAPPPPSLRLQVPRRVHFALDRSDISPASAALLDQVITVLRQHPMIVIDLEGHTDPRASDAYNQALGLRRAQSVRNYLLRRGIDPARLTIRSLGESRRRSQGNTRLDYARDRRVEIYFRDVRGIEIQFVDQETDLQIEGR